MGAASDDVRLDDAFFNDRFTVSAIAPSLVNRSLSVPTAVRRRFVVVASADDVVAALGEGLRRRRGAIAMWRRARVSRKVRRERCVARATGGDAFGNAMCLSNVHRWTSRPRASTPRAGKTASTTGEMARDRRTRARARVDGRDDARGRGRGTNEGRMRGRRDGDDDERALVEQLRALGLERREVEADGNCFFRALADQRFGDEGRHEELRKMVVAAIRRREEDYAPFVEDDEDFESYVERMSRDGEWAGHLEVSAAAGVLGVGVCIHQSGSPRWVSGAEATDERCRTYHVSYEGCDHYNSVRIRGSKAGTPAGPLSVSLLRDPDLREIARRSGCYETEHLRRALRACRNDVDAAVDVIEDELEEEARAREKAIGDGVDIAEFDGGDWAEVKTKHKGKKKGGNRGRHRRDGGIEKVDSFESLAI